MRMFLGGSKGFSLYEDGDVTQASGQGVLCLVRTAEGGVLAGTAGGQVLAWSGVGDARVLAKDLGDAVTSLALARSGRLIAGCLPVGAWRSKDVGESWTPIKSLAGSPGADSWSPGDGAGSLPTPAAAVTPSGSLQPVATASSDYLRVTHPLDAQRAMLTIGRDPANDITLDVPLVSRHHAHLEGTGALDHFAADAAQTDDAQRLAAQLAAHEFLLLPLAGARGGVGLRDVPRHREHHAERVLGDRDRVSARRVHDQDTGIRGRVEVHVVDAHAGAADHAQLRRFFKDTAIYLHRSAHE